MFFGFFTPQLSPRGLNSPFLEITKEMEETIPPSYRIMDMAHHIGAVTTNEIGEEIYWIAFPEDNLREKGYTEEELKIKLRKKFRDRYGL